jgi:hypothetical protein
LRQWIAHRRGEAEKCDAGYKADDDDRERDAATRFGVVDRPEPR